jgi:5-bromo-4-chloroindolyl phosphate hydrolysis protein
MDFIKKNPLLCAWLLVSLILAVFLGWRISGAMAAAAEASGQFDELREFGQRERRASYSASNENLAISKRNLERAETELRNLRVALYQRSNVVHEGNVSHTK